MLRDPVFTLAFAADQNRSLPPSPTLQHTLGPTAKPTGSESAAAV
ncbi:hypothetical protein TGAMA5MH_01546 [Trichoderma gamsii]|nr:hypothetical protein TGAMA5MH_01546 [Trichoderma gamsii]